jgi:hypothetical protein
MSKDRISESVNWVDIHSLKQHPKNRNQHSPAQLDRLADIIRYQGWRHPIIVSHLSGYIVAGHGRLEAAKLLKLTRVPVQMQEFESYESEYAFLVSDNSIAAWADLDLSGINEDIKDFGPELELDHLGIKDFVVDISEKDGDYDPGEDSPKDSKSPTICPACGFCIP